MAIKIPDEVVNKKAYLKYLGLMKHPILTKDKIYEASDGQSINLAWLPHHMRKKIEHLPEKEQRLIEKKKDEYFKINNNLTAQKRIAYGLTQGQKKGGAKHQSLIEVKKDEIIDLMGRMFSNKEILKVINDEWKIPFNKIATLQKFRRENAKLIEESIEKYKASYVDVRLGQKRSRLDELTYMFKTQKEKYQKKLSNESARLMLNIIEQIRKESEGDRLTITGKVDIGYEEDIQKHLHQEIFKTLNIKEIILSRVAARMGLNPIKLIHGLNESYYAKYSNVLGNLDPDVDETDIVYPSSQSYDFERIKKVQKTLDKNAEDAVILEEQKDSKKDLTKAEKKRSKILAKLKRKTAQLNDTKAKQKAHDDNRK